MQSPYCLLVRFWYFLYNDHIPCPQDVGSKAKEFGYLSGAYNMDLIVGDAVIQNPFSWTLAEVILSFPDSAAAPEDHMNRYKPKPEIEVGTGEVCWGSETEVFDI